jgi:hypothetical protein
MKFLMKVGDELDLNVSYDGGAVDGVGYEVPAVCADIISVNAAGIVEALALGDGIVNVTSAGAVIGSIVFSVLSQADYDAKQAIRGGEKALIVGAQEVVPVPSGPILMHPTTFTGPSVLDQLSGGQIYQNGGYSVSAYGVVYYGYWSAAFDHSAALAVWDGNGQTYTGIDTGAPTQFITWITIPTAKRIAKIEIDISQATLTGTNWRLEGQTPADLTAPGTNGGLWTTLVPETGFTSTSGTISFNIQHGLIWNGTSSDLPYQKFKIRFYTHSPINGVNSRIDVSAIRLYEPIA